MIPLVFLGMVQAVHVYLKILPNESVIVCSCNLLAKIWFMYVTSTNVCVPGVGFNCGMIGYSGDQGLGVHDVLA